MAAFLEIIRHVGRLPLPEFPIQLRGGFPDVKGPPVGLSLVVTVTVCSLPIAQRGPSRRPAGTPTASLPVPPARRGRSLHHFAERLASSTVNVSGFSPVDVFAARQASMTTWYCQGRACRSKTTSIVLAIEHFAVVFIQFAAELLGQLFFADRAIDVGNATDVAMGPRPPRDHRTLVLHADGADPEAIVFSTSGLAASSAPAVKM